MAAPTLNATTGSTAEHDDLRDMVRRFVAKELPLDETRIADPASARLTGWAQLAELGLLGLAVPEEYGGSGAGIIEVSIVCEELARELVPLPYFATVCLAAEVLTASEDPEACADLLGAIASGELTATVARERCQAACSGESWTVSGSLRHVLDGADADLLLVLAETPRGSAIFAITGTEGVDRAPLDTLDATRPLADITLTGAPARMIGPWRGELQPDGPAPSRHRGRRGDHYSVNG
jgi:3-oxochol-4-en-24-oyl-CoA dehydrogenase